MAWLENALYVQNTCGSFIDWEERFYICPECDEPVYECDWTDVEMREFLCPICELTRTDLQ